MANQPQDRRPHLILINSAEQQRYTAHNDGPRTPNHIPELPRQAHAAALTANLAHLKQVSQTVVEEQRNLNLESGLGLQVQFISQVGIELAFESLQNDTQHIELLSVKNEGNITTANVFVPDGKLEHFEKYISEYLAEKKNKNDDPIDHRNLIDTISAIRSAEVRALWTDEIDQLPQNIHEQFWWEVWLTNREDRELTVNDFKKLAFANEIVLGEGRVDFPERTVIQMFASESQLTQSVMMLNCVAELRRAKDTAEFFDAMNNEEQNDWLNDLLQRTNFAPHTPELPRLCLIDSGVNRGHALLTPLLNTEDLYSVRPNWGMNDNLNHGTGLAGIAGYGDLTEALSNNNPIQINYSLESVKIINEEGGNVGAPAFHADLFSDAVNQPEVVFAHSPRVFSCAITAKDYRDLGRPSSWSATVDNLSSDAENLNQKRLIILSAGNVKDQHSWSTYPDSIATNQIHDPGQAWNALTVGAFTEKTNVIHSELRPLAPEGAISPFSTSSRTWESAWPIKPEVVFEGGNLGLNIGDGFVSVEPSLGLLTTNNEPTNRLFTTTNATSAASALCGRMAVKLMTSYPNLNPESIRALITHSAEWTERMKLDYLPSTRRPNKSDYLHLIKHCGWGVPSEEKANWSASNSLTLITEDQIFPYIKEEGRIKTRDMNIHNLPWPLDELHALGNTIVQMRVTLSYFIEPNPSARGSSSKFHYPSCRLRFDVRRPLETDADFQSRVNAQVTLGNDHQYITNSDPNWKLGETLRHRGSLHQDIWEGTAADLASRGSIAIYPAMGWWRTRPKLGKYDSPLRYTLIVSIRTPQTEVDIYNPVYETIATTAQAAIQITT